MEVRGKLREGTNWTALHDWDWKEMHRIRRSKTD